MLIYEKIDYLGKISKAQIHCFQNLVHLSGQLLLDSTTKFANVDLQFSYQQIEQKSLDRQRVHVIQVIQHHQVKCPGYTRKTTSYIRNNYKYIENSNIQDIYYEKLRIYTKSLVLQYTVSTHKFMNFSFLIAILNSLVTIEAIDLRTVTEC